MLSLTVFALLVVRYRRIGRIARMSSDPAVRQMRRLSANSLYTFLAFTVVSFVPYVATLSDPTRNPANWTAVDYLSIAAWSIGLVLAAIYDFKAEQIRKRVRIHENRGDAVRPQNLIRVRPQDLIKERRLEQRDAERLWRNATKSEARGDVDGARRIYDQLVRVFPSSVHTAEARARLLALDPNDRSNHVGS